MWKRALLLVVAAAAVVVVVKKINDMRNSQEIWQEALKDSDDADRAEIETAS